MDVDARYALAWAALLAAGGALEAAALAERRRGVTLCAMTRAVYGLAGRGRRPALAASLCALYWHLVADWK